MVGFLSASHTDEAITLALSENAREGTKLRTLAFDELSHAIELGLIERAASLPYPNVGEPFAGFARLFKGSLSESGLVLHMWRALLLSLYNEVPQKCRDLASERQARSFIERSRDLQLTALKVGIVAAIVSGLVGILTLLK
jgi:hypothetical protein